MRRREWLTKLPAKLPTKLPTKQSSAKRPGSRKKDAEIAVGWDDRFDGMLADL
jgi:hypothetical protein